MRLLLELLSHQVRRVVGEETREDENRSGPNGCLRCLIDPWGAASGDFPS